MHAIQQDILRRLTLHPQARYSDLKSDEIDGNLFMYHLNQLMRAEYVSKEDKTYLLSEKGLRYVGMLSTSTGEQRVQPQIIVMVVCRNPEGQYALFRWIREPNAGKVSIPHGKMHFGASIAEMAVQELKEKTGLEGVCSYRGEAYLRFVIGTDTRTHQLVHVFKADSLTGELHSSTPNGEVFWGSPNDIPETQVLPGMWEIVDLLERHEGFFFEDLVIEAV